MRETPRAQQAWADYLAMGAGRSLEKLLAAYRVRQESAGRTSVPAVRLRTLYDWSSAFGWQDRLSEIAERESQETIERRSAERRELEGRGIRDRDNRVSQLADLHGRLMQIIESRAEHYGKLLDGAPVAETGPYHRPEWIAPGADTGVLFFTRKVMGKVVTEEWAADVGVLKEIRATQEQVARELGQWEEKKRVSIEVEKELEAALERLRDQLPPEEFARAVAALANGDAGEE
jgi:hypothetical protein